MVVIPPCNRQQRTSIEPSIPFDGLVVDLDGVVWIGREAVPRAPEALRVLQRSTRIAFVTNDPVAGRLEIAERLAELGVAATGQNVITSAYALASLVQRTEGTGAPGYVSGSQALKQEMRDAGLRILDGEKRRNARFVAVGAHPGFNYEELRIATQAIRSGARFFAAGRDATFPMPDGPWPATGSIVAALEFATGRPAAVAGKPEPYLFELARTALGNERRIAVVGDRLDSDIAGGKRAGLPTILVMTGSTTLGDLDRPGAPVPDVVLPSIADLPDWLERHRIAQS
jgi:glycerol 3-phosphatase-2